MDRPAIPADVIRAVLVEAGHRCAIPTCRATTTEIAHIEAWAKSQDSSFGNLIALCPNCHTRYDQKKDIDGKAMRTYKQNLAILNNRYGDLERRLFEHVSRTNARVLLVGAGSELLLANAVIDGLLTIRPSHGLSIGVSMPDGTSTSFPMGYVCEITDAGLEFIGRYSKGVELP
jgi:hypothetical protein